mmetsp:Transcript_110280/g.318748  ORF Transcript_110280/g.318748 Transcript_110280/m.318748 type:complete len:252 (+) Transcript_110280:412-1167(+)
MQRALLVGGEGSEAVSSMSAVRVRTDKVVLHVVGLQGGEVSEELVVAAEVATYIAHVVHLVHVPQELVFVEQAKIAELTQRMRRHERRLARPLILEPGIPLAAMPLHVPVTIHHLVADESGPPIQASLAELAPVRVPQVVLELTQRAERGAALRAGLDPASILEESHYSSADLCVGEADAEALVFLEKVELQRLEEQWRGVVCDQHLVQLLLAHWAAVVPGDGSKPHGAHPAGIGMATLADADVGRGVGAT